MMHLDDYGIIGHFNNIFVILIILYRGHLFVFGPFSVFTPFVCNWLFCVIVLCADAERAAFDVFV